MEERKVMLYKIKYAGGMALCVILSVLILVLGRHDEAITEEIGTVDASCEAVDGDLDFGETVGTGSEKQPEQDPAMTLTEVPTVAPTPEGDIVITEAAGTEDDPILITDEMFAYRVVDGKATVYEAYATEAEELVIPATKEGYPVVAIGEYLCQGFAKLKHISLPEGLEEIGAYAFENCVSIETVEFPSTLKTIRDSAFFSCNGLTSIAIPEKTKTIEDYAFFACDNLTELSLYQTSNLDMIFDMSIITKVTVGEGVSYIAESAFEYCENLREVTLPSTVTTIKAYAFYGCTALEQLTLPEGLVSIGENVFENCIVLQSINIPNSVMLISEYAFCSCESLEQLSLPDEITSIGDGAFDGCENLVLWVAAESAGEEYAVKNDILYEMK